MNKTSKWMLATAIALCAGAAGAEDLNKVKVVFDPGFTDRTNMGRPAGETSDVMAAYDAGLMARTGVKDATPQVSAVTVARDTGFMSRTNMGGSALRNNDTATAMRQ